MASKEIAVAVIDPHQLASVIRGSRLDKVLIVDSRSFLEYNDLHIRGAVNVWCSKLVKRRLQQDKVCVRDFLLHSCHLGAVDESGDVIVYDQSSVSAASVSPDSFLHVLLHKFVHVFRRVFLLSGGFSEFQACYGDMCEDKSRLMRSTTLSMTSLSQPCLPITNVGPTRILPFLYLGSQQDAHNQELLSDYNITYEVNVSTNCPKPEFIQDSHFLRLPVNDSYGEKLLPYFVRATQFIDKVRESNGSVLVHCLAGISRSPTVAIAYVMRHLQMTFDDAFRYVKSKRTSISPNFNFLGQLLEYERQLRAEDDAAAAAASLPPTPAAPTRLSRSISLSLSLKSPPTLETVPHSPDLLLNPFDEVDSGGGATDLSPTTALARLSFEAMPQEESSYVMVSRRKESYRTLRQRTSSSSESHHFFSKQKTETTSSRSSMVLTVSQSKRVTSGSAVTGRCRWKPPIDEQSHCSQISVQIEGSTSADAEDHEVEIRRRGPAFPRPHSDGGYRNLAGHQQQQHHPLQHTRSVPRRPSYAPSETSSTISDELLPPTPSSPNPSHCLLSPQTWGSGLYARSDSVTTSGLGSEISDCDTRGDDALSLCSGSVRCFSGLGPSEETESDSLPPDDGVFTEPLPPVRPPLRSTRPRPSSLLGIIPVKDLEWKPSSSCNSGQQASECSDTSCNQNPFPALRRARPTSLLNPLVLPSPTSSDASGFPSSLNQSTSGVEEMPDSATVFRLWRQREAALEQDRPDSHPVPMITRRRSKEMSASNASVGRLLLHQASGSSTPEATSKRKSSEMPEESQSPPAVVEKRRSTRGPFIRISMAR